MTNSTRSLGTTRDWTEMRHTRSDRYQPLLRSNPSRKM